jgi:TetR/AcrR family transcriptional regulator, transcriptional repressor for nem operon
MPPSRKHHNRIRDLVLQSAGRLFNRHGFNAVSIHDVMAEAGLTRGSFYCYFASKSDLYAQSVARVVHEIVKIRRAADPNARVPTRSCRTI